MNYPPGVSEVQAPVENFFEMNYPPGVSEVQAPVEDGVHHDYDSGIAKMLGGLQVTLGILILGCQAGLYCRFLENTDTGYLGSLGLIASIPIIMAGAFGVKSSRTKSTCSVNAAMLLSANAAILSCMVICEGLLFSIFGSHYYYHDKYARAILGTMVFLGCVEAIVAGWASVICCEVACRSRTSRGVHHNYKSGAAKTLGIFQIILGITILGCQVAVYVIHAVIDYPFYAGSFGIIAPWLLIAGGSLGVRSSRTKSASSVTAVMVLSNLAVFFSFAVIIEGVYFGFIVVTYCNRYCFDYEVINRITAWDWGTFVRYLFIMQKFYWAMAGFGFIGAIVAIAASAICCQATCRRSKSVLESRPGHPRPRHEHPRL